jgi:hypothetical protein
VARGVEDSVRPTFTQPAIQVGQDCTSAAAVGIVASRLAAEDEATNAQLTRLWRLGWGNTPRNRIPPAVLAGEDIPGPEAGSRAKEHGRAGGKTARRDKRHVTERCTICGRPITHRRTAEKVHDTCSYCRRGRVGP